MRSRKLVVIGALIATLLGSGGWAVACPAEGGPSGSEATGNPAKPKKVTTLGIEVDWTSSDELVTIYWHVPQGLTEYNCEAGARRSASKAEKAKHNLGYFPHPTQGNPLVHRMEPPLICDWGNYHDGDPVSVSALQQKKGSLSVAIWVDGRQVSYNSTLKAGEIITAVYPLPKQA